MTTAEIVSYYQGLLIIQYINKTKARGTIGALVEPVVMDQLPVAVQSAFDLETAIGVQLDIVGKYAGVVRNGFDFSGPIILSDDDFRTLIKVAIIRNNSGSSLYDIQKLLHQFFPDSLLVFDYQTMHMSYVFSTTIGSRQLAEMFVKQGLLPKPMGVALSSVIYGLNFFGFRTYFSPPFHTYGFQRYSSFDTSKKWLRYSDIISA